MTSCKNTVFWLISKRNNGKNAFCSAIKATFFKKIAKISCNYWGDVYYNPRNQKRWVADEILNNDIIYYTIS